MFDQLFSCRAYCVFCDVSPVGRFRRQNANRVGNRWANWLLQSPFLDRSPSMRNDSWTMRWLSDWDGRTGIYG